MGSFLNSAFFFVLALGVLITVHEFGHFWVARRCGVKVLKFSIGFGSALWSRTGRDGVEYVLAVIPLGGYVKMLDESEGPVDPEEVSYAFNRKPVGQRLLIALAGPLANFLLAILLYTVVFISGIEGLKPVIGEVNPDGLAAQAGLQQGDEILQIGNDKVSSWQQAAFVLLNGYMDRSRVNILVKDQQGKSHSVEIDFSQIAEMEQERIDVLRFLGITPYYPDIPPIVGQVQPEGAAARAGLQSGDRILTVDQEKIESWQEWVEKIRRNPDQTLVIKLLRQEREMTLQIRPESRTSGEEIYGFIGVAPNREQIQALMQDYRVTVAYPAHIALLQAAQKTWEMSRLTLQVLGKILLGEASVSNLSGPISIAQYAGDTASAGLNSYLLFLAVISISLGVLNLLPIPVLDGGHILFYCYEGIRRKPLPESVQLTGVKIGMMILAVLMCLAFYNDILRLIGKGQ
ncbi:MAG: RIP metalloprotease RseP [Gammaproteobacteria bacterium]|nr:MAG: RIP metalloprotease RseP [Gammaproteobacteria bacterium]